jgi:NTP pyrophosphatase (non-canonical NTP hydrolase)
MMTIRQYYLNKLAEECAEVAQCCHKQMIFGPHHGRVAEPSNREQLRKEVNDLLGCLDVLLDIDELPEISTWELLEAKNQKRQKMATYLQYSQSLGNVENINRPVGLKIHDTFGIEPEPDATGG